MNHTQNYQLNQWEPGDPVLHTDFNEDNRKIDAALTEKCTMYRRYHNGRDRCGQDHPSEIPFPDPPNLVIIFDKETGKYIMWNSNLKVMCSPFFPNNPCPAQLNPKRDPEDGTWSWNLCWYSDTPEHQFDVLAKTYHVISLI